MMDNLLPKIKTIRIMLRDMSEQQEAVFRMAFKMHNTTNYQILDSDSDEIPRLLMVLKLGKRSKSNTLIFLLRCFVRKSHLLQRRIWLSRLNSIPYSRF